MSATEAIRVPMRCSSCGELLYTRVRVCPLCGVADPLEAAEAAAAREGADASAIDAPADAAAERERAAGVPDVAGAGQSAEAIAGDASEVGAEATDTSASEAEVSEADVGASAVDGAAAAAGRAAARAGMLDIAPDRDGPAPEPGRDLVIVPQRGGRDVALYAPRRRGALAMVLTALGAVLLLAVVGVFAWRLVGPMQAAAPAAREVAVGRSWQPLELPPLAAGEDWVLSADGPFRLRIDGLVYTLASPVPFAVPLDGKSVEIRAVADDVTVSVSRR